MRLFVTLILIIFPFFSIKASEFKQTEENFSLRLNRIIEISRNKELKIENRIVLLNTELKQLDLNVEKLNHDFLIDHKKLFFKMMSTRNYLETYLDKDFTVNNCNSYRLSIIHGFSPRNAYPKMIQIPEGAYLSLKVLSILCSNPSILDFTQKVR
ncbi:hypothetical protein [Methyloprofundus sp.]|uniref:hypothetical protein n=1 Tax=Methyloprofundus sp. TaxID=2020875 RepID=UPI003D0F71B1